MEALNAEARVQTERVQTLEERARILRLEVADAKEAAAKVERWAKDLEASLAAEKGRATRQAKESAVKVARLEGLSQTLRVRLEAATARLAAEEEKARVVVALMEAAKKRRRRCRSLKLR